MQIDLVHDIQSSYRKLVDAMARPGQHVSLNEAADKLSYLGELPCHPASVILALMLLDTEVAFHVAGELEKAEAASRLFNKLTYARAVEAAQADYIFILENGAAETKEQAIREAKIGDLIEPHRSATTIVETASLTCGGQGEGWLALQGPGIEKVNWLRAEGDFAWVRIRADKNKEYPMGIDMIFVDREQRVTCLPRTTQLHEERLVGS